jgi:MFS family permease
MGRHVGASRNKREVNLGQAQAEDRPDDIRRSGRFILSGLSVSHGLFHTFHQSLVVLLPEIKDAFNLTEVGVGAIAATERTADGLVSAPAGIASDMHRRHWGLILAVCMGLFGVGWLIIGSAPVFAILLVGIAVVAVAASVWHLPATAAISEHFPTKRATALGVHAIGGNIGDVVGPLMTTGILLGILTWRGVLSAYAIAPLVMVAVVYWAFRNIGALPGTRYQTPTMRTQLALTKRLLKNRTLWGINLVSALRNMSFISMITFLPIYFDDELGMSSAARGFHIALLMLVGMFSTPFLGYLSDLFGRKQVLVPALVLLCGATLLLVPWGEGITLTAIIVLMSLFLYSDQPILTAAALDIVGRRVVNTTLGVLTLARLAPSAAGPLIAGALYQAFGIHATFYFVAGIFALSAAVLLFIPLTNPNSGGGGRSLAAEKHH